MQNHSPQALNLDAHDTIISPLMGSRMMDSQAQKEPTQPTALTAVVNLCVELQGFAPVPQPVKLRPGPPISLHMNAGHPFKEQACSSSPPISFGFHSTLKAYIIAFSGRLKPVGVDCSRSAGPELSGASPSMDQLRL